MKVYTSYVLSIVFKKVIVWGYPFSITTEPTNHCNLGCIECPTGNKLSKRPAGNMNVKLYKNLIDQIKDHIIYQMLYFQGEPFLHPHFFDLIKYANQNNIYTTTSTNGHFLTQENCYKIIKSGLKKITISLDGTDQKSYEKYRVGGNFNTVINGIKTLVSIKKELNSRFPLISVQFLVFSHNENQIEKIKMLTKQLKVNKLILKSAQIENFEQNRNLIPNIKRFARYSEKKQNLIKTKLRNRCFRIWSTAVITWEGLLISCCFDKNSTNTFGDTNYNDLKNLWVLSNFNGFRNEIIQNRKKNAICRNCSEGLRIKY